MLYFFGSSKHTNSSDFTVLQDFQMIVSVIPVIFKEDSFKTNELLRLKLDLINTWIDRKFKFFKFAAALDEVSGDVR